MARTGPARDSLNTYEFSTHLVDVTLPDDRDVAPLFELLIGPEGREVTDMLVWDGPESPANTEDWVRRCRTETFGDWGYHWVIRTKDGESIGAIGTRPRDEDGRADVGYWLGRPHWGRGIMSGALAELLRLGFEELSFFRMEADVFAHNSAGRRLVEKRGMTLEGIVREAFRKRGQLVDVCIYGLLVDEWSRR